MPTEESIDWKVGALVVRDIFLAAATPRIRPRARESGRHTWPTTLVAPSRSSVAGPASPVAKAFATGLRLALSEKTWRRPGFIVLVRPPGFEPGTVSLKGSCSTN